MSRFKKMRLVNDNDKNMKEDIQNIIKYETPIHLQNMSDLDQEIDSILKSKIDLNTKAKLYSEILRKFLLFKKIHDKKTKFNQMKSNQNNYNYETNIETGSFGDLELESKSKRTKRDISENKFKKPDSVQKINKKSIQNNNNSNINTKSFEAKRKIKLNKKQLVKSPKGKSGVIKAVAENILLPLIQSKVQSKNVNPWISY